MTRNSVIAVVALLVALGVVAWTIARSGDAPAAVAELPQASAQPSAESGPVALEVPRPAEQGGASAAPEAPESTDARAAEPPAAPVDFETLYRFKTVDELDTRASELMEAVSVACAKRVNERAQAGEYERLSAAEAASRDQSSVTADGRRRTASLVSNENLEALGQRGWIEFVLLEEPATADLERERLYVRARRAELQELESQRRAAAAAAKGR